MAFLVLLGAASLVALLTWAGTKGKFPLFTAVLLAGATAATLAAVVDRSNVQLANVDEAQAEEPETPVLEPVAAEPVDVPVEALPPEPPPGPKSVFDQFVVEPVTAEQFFSNPTAFTVGPEGELYVGHDYGIGVARDTTGDGFFDSQEHFGLESSWVFGLAYHEDALYAAVAGSALRLRDADGDGFADEITTLVEGLPHNHYGGHSNNGLAVGPAGLLYMTVGGTSDHGPELEPFAGTILTVPVEGGAPSVHARGFRNPYDVDFCNDGRLYATDNGPDQMEQDLISRPWDEVNLVVQGGHYGYPHYFGTAPPESGTRSPVSLVAPSAGITGLACYTAYAFPEEFHGDLFVTLWGTFTFPIETGRKLVRINVEETPEGPRGRREDFAVDFGRPIDVVVDGEGHLLVLDHQLGQVFRIRYADS